MTDRAKAFISEFKELLEKYSAELDLEEDPYSGENRMVIDMNTIFDTDNSYSKIIHKYEQIILPDLITATSEI